MFKLALGLAAMAAGLIVCAPASAQSSAGGLPTRVGQCVTTQITAVGSRLKGVADSGSAVAYANGGHQVSYQVSPIVRDWRVGDVAEMCLAAVPDECPAGDDRGRVYGVINLRTRTRWDAPNSEHDCGGA